MAKELANNLKKEWAKELYVSGEHTQKSISEKVKISEQTICKWVKDGKWDKERKTLLATKKEQLLLLYDQLDNLSKQNKIFQEDDDPDTNPNFDAVIKLVNAIKKLETKTGVGEMIDTAKRFIKFVQPENLELAKEITKWFDLFIQDELSKQND